MASTPEIKLPHRQSEEPDTTARQSSSSTDTASKPPTANESDEKRLDMKKSPSSGGLLWKSLRPDLDSPGVLTPSATTPGATTPGVFSFDEPFEDVKRKGVDPAALRAKIDHVHDGGLEGGFHHGDDGEH